MTPTPGFVIPIWALIAVCSAASIGIIALCLYFWRQAKAMDALWLPLSRLSIPSVRYLSVVPITEAKLADAVERAFHAMAVAGPWDTDKLRAALAGLRIQINPVESWEARCIEQGCTPPRVAGQALVEVKTIAVGPSLAALAHEACHVAEYVLDGFVDYQHSGWERRGLYAVCNAYQGGNT